MNQFKYSALQLAVFSLLFGIDALTGLYTENPLRTVISLLLALIPIIMIVWKWRRGSVLRYPEFFILFVVLYSYSLFWERHSLNIIFTGLLSVIVIGVLLWLSKQWPSLDERSDDDQESYL